MPALGTGSFGHSKGGVPGGITRLADGRGNGCLHMAVGRMV